LLAQQKIYNCKNEAFPRVYPSIRGATSSMSNFDAKKKGSISSLYKFNARVISSSSNLDAEEIGSLTQAEFRLWKKILTRTLLARHLYGSFGSTYVLCEPLILAL
jgi:hypothetical protein